MIKVNRRSMATGNMNTMELPLTEQDLMGGEYERAYGKLIQDVYPQLNPDQREFLISGSTPEEWEEMFGGDE